MNIHQDSNLSEFESSLEVKTLPLSFNPHATNNTVKAYYKDNGDVTIYGGVLTDITGMGLSLIGISKASARPKSSVVGFCGAYNQSCGDVTITTNGEILFNIPTAPAWYTFNITYNAK